MENERNRTLQTEGELEIDLFELFFLFRKKLKAILLCAVIGALLVGLYTWFFIPPQYQATAKLYIVSASSNSVVNLTDLQIASSLTSDYKELILGRPMMESTIKNLQLEGYNAGGLRRLLNVTNPSGTRILYITATTLDPELSCRIANEVARLSVSWLPEIMESNEPNISEEAVVPSYRSSPSYSKNAILGALVGAVLCYGFAVLQYIMDDTISSADEMEKYFGVVRLTSVPEDAAANDGSRDEERGGFMHRIFRRGAARRFGQSKLGSLARKAKKRREAK